MPVGHRAKGVAGDAEEVVRRRRDREHVRRCVGGRALNPRFVIPAGAPNHEVRASRLLEADTLVTSFTPHMHVRGKSMTYTARFPDGSTEVLLSVPKYDFNWQHEYVFSTPLMLPAGTKLHAKAWYDNSARNKSNPDPTKTVTWGDQTWEEMMYTSITYSFAPQPSTAAPQQQR